MRACRARGEAIDQISGLFGGKDFDRHVAIEAGVAGFIDLAHASGADEAEDFVRTEPHAGGEGHREVARPEYTTALYFPLKLPRQMDLPSISRYPAQPFMEKTTAELGLGGVTGG